MNDFIPSVGSTLGYDVSSSKGSVFFEYFMTPTEPVVMVYSTEGVGKGSSLMPLSLFAKKDIESDPAYKTRGQNPSRSQTLLTSLASELRRSEIESCDHLFTHLDPEIRKDKLVATVNAIADRKYWRHRPKFLFENRYDPKTHLDACLENNDEPE